MLVKINISVEADSQQQAAEVLANLSTSFGGSVAPAQQYGRALRHDQDKAAPAVVDHAELKAPAPQAEAPAPQAEAVTEAPAPSADEVQTGGSAVAAPAGDWPPSVDLSVGLDSDGVPWDKRIHSSAQTKLAKSGEWKLIRGIDKDLVTRVISELKAISAGKTQAPEAEQPQQNDAGVAFGAPPQQPQQNDAGAAFGAPPQQPPQGPALNVATFNAKVIGAINGKLITMDQVTAALQARGLHNLGQVAASGDAALMSGLLSDLGVA